MRLGQADLALYRELIVVLAVDVAVLYVGVFPALLFLLGERSNPYRALYAALGPALTGLVSGDSYVSLGALVVHGRESFRLPRRVSATVFPLCAVFGRAGSALVTGIGYLMVLRSYTSFEVTVEQLLFAALFTFLLSFVAGAVPGLGTTGQPDHTVVAVRQRARRRSADHATGAAAAHRRRGTARRHHGGAHRAPGGPPRGRARRRTPAPARLTCPTPPSLLPNRRVPPEVLHGC